MPKTASARKTKACRRRRRVIGGCGRNFERSSFDELREEKTTLVILEFLDFFSSLLLRSTDYLPVALKLERGKFAQQIEEGNSRAFFLLLLILGPFH